jgi:hypothetical protein
MAKLTPDYKEKKWLIDVTGLAKDALEKMIERATQDVERNNLARLEILKGNTSNPENAEVSNIHNATSLRNTAMDVLKQYELTLERLHVVKIDETDSITSVRLGGYVILAIDNTRSRFYVSGLSDPSASETDPNHLIRMLGWSTFYGKPVPLGQEFLKYEITEGDALPGFPHISVEEIGWGGSTAELEKRLKLMLINPSTESKQYSLAQIEEELDRTRRSYINMTGSDSDMLDKYVRADRLKGRINIRMNAAPEVRHFFRNYQLLKDAEKKLKA